MKTNKDGRYLIESYIEEVGTQLPLRQRADIQAEIRSLLEDTLEDRLAETGGAADVETVAALLKEFGSPDKMAASYAPDRYLVGPKLFPLFTLVTKIVFAVLIVLGIIGAGIAAAPAETFKAALLSIGSSLLEMFNGLMSTLAWIVIVFAILERTLPEHEKEEKDWDPRKLERIPDQDKIKLIDPITNMIFATIGIVIFNFFPQIIRGISFSENGMEVFELLSMNFYKFIPWLTAIWALEMLFSIYLLRQRKWQIATRWVRIGLDTLTIALFAAMLFGGPLIATDPAAIAAWPDESLVPLAETGIKALFGIILILQGISIGEGLFKIFKKQSVPTL